MEGFSSVLLLRSIFGAVLPLVARPMYENLGIGWATSLLGFISVALAGLPFLFITYGAK
jgi:DHA1 family multidrug resistance protein-like MFS transporter